MAAPRSKGPSGRVRIIGGSLRGSRLDVAAAPGLRPSSDRVRETLFNWLAPHVAGRHCLDLFAGSGALGFEAISRGAARVTLVERNPQLVASLQANARRLRQPAVEVVCADALAWLGQPGRGPFDLVFLDPPFGAGLLAGALGSLAGHLRHAALLYVEHARSDIIRFNPDWELLREGSTREVRFALYRRAPGGAAAALPDTLSGQPNFPAHGAE